MKRQSFLNHFKRTEKSFSLRQREIAEAWFVLTEAVVREFHFLRRRLHHH